MDPNGTQSNDYNGLSAQSLAGTAISLARQAEQQHARLQRAIAARDGCEPVYGETEANFKERRQRVEADYEHQLKMSDALLDDLTIKAQRLQRRLDAPTSYGLTSTEWTLAGGLEPLAQRMVLDRPIGEGLAALRSAVASGDRPRMAAFAIVAEHRLKTANQATADGKTPWPAEADELRRLVGQAKQALRDRTLDAAREEARQFTIARGKLGSLRVKEGARRRQQAEFDRGERVPWPAKEPA